MWEQNGIEKYVHFNGGDLIAVFYLFRWLEAQFNRDSTLDTSTCTWIHVEISGFWDHRWDNGWCNWPDRCWTWNPPPWRRGPRLDDHFLQMRPVLSRHRLRTANERRSTDSRLHYQFKTNASSHRSLMTKLCIKNAVKQSFIITVAASVVNLADF